MSALAANPDGGSAAWALRSRLFAATQREQRVPAEPEYSGALSTEEATMVKLVGAYGMPEDTEAFDAHYGQTHAPLAEKIPNTRRYEYGKVLGTADGSDAPYYFLAELWFDSPDELQAALGSPEGQAAAADLANFASGGVTLMIAEA